MTGSMPCAEAQSMLALWLDGEISGLEAEEIEKHVALCISCMRTARYTTAMRRALVRSGMGLHAPLVLRTGLERACRDAQRDSDRRRMWRTFSTAAVCLMVGFMTLKRGVSENSLEHMTARHAGNLKMDVESNDVNSVQTYLSGHLPFAMRLPALNEQVRPQRMGARVIQLNNQDAAYIRYDTSRGRVSIVVHPDASTWIPQEEPVFHRMRGYSVARWHDGGLVYSVVTDSPDVVHYAVPARMFSAR